MKRSTSRNKAPARSRPSPSAVKSSARKPKSSPTSTLSPRPSTILLAVTGMSPAVLTETVWALAHPTDGSQPVIPDLVVVVTTAAGRQAIERELLSSAAPASETSPAAPSVWEQLRAAVLGAAHSRDPRLILQPPRIIEAPNRRSGHADWLDDIQTPEQNEAAADFILEEVRRIAFNDDTMLVASLAGGRKTMGALLYAALSLLGRPQDRLTHVLVNEPFDHPALRPRFYFQHPPETSYRLEGRDGRATEHSSRSARLQLADVPFVRLRRLFPSQLGRWPGRFSDLVRHYSEQLDRLAGPPSVQLDHSKLQVRVNDVPVGLTVREFAIFAFLAERCRDGHAAYAKQNMALTDFAAWLTRWATRFDPFTPQRAVADGWKKPEDDDLRRQLSEVRKKFRMAGLGRFESFLLPTRGSFGVRVLLSA